MSTTAAEAFELLGRVDWGKAARLTVPEIGEVIVPEVGVPLLVVETAGAVTGLKPVSRELGERIGAAERRERAHLVAEAHGGPAALPTPSPFVHEAFVHGLPTQAELDAHVRLAPHAVPGSSPELLEDYAHFAKGKEWQRYPHVDSNALAEGARALADTDRCFPGSRSFEGKADKAFGDLKDVVQPPKDWQTHHLVEQNQVERFGTQAIQNTANVISLPDKLHKRVSDFYSTKPLEKDLAHFKTFREYVQTLSYAEQRHFSIEVVRDQLDNPRSQVSDKDRATIEKGLQRLENQHLDIDRCPPEPSRADDLGNAVDQLRSSADAAKDRTQPQGERSRHETSNGHHEPARAGDHHDERVSAAPVLHIFRDGHKQAVSLGHEQTGKIYNLGQFMAVQDAHGDHTVYVKRELAAPGKREALELAMRDGATLSIGVTREGVHVQQATPAHETGHGLGHVRAVTQTKGHGLER